MSDEENDLQKRLQEEDQQALADIFAQHRERLWRTIHFRMDPQLRGRIDPDDVLQETYLAAAKRLVHYKKSAMSPFVWLRAITQQTLIDLHRRHVGAKKRSAEKEVAIHQRTPQHDTSAAMVIQLVGNMTSPSQAIMKQEVQKQIEHAIEGMDNIDREVLALRHFEELSNSEVAEVLEIEQKAASIRYIRALKRLKGILSQMSTFSDEGKNA